AAKMKNDYDDNIVDITGQLPEPDLYLRWRDRLPAYYAKHFDLLQAQQDAIKEMRRTLTSIHLELQRDLESDRRVYRPEEQALEQIQGALVLLECAEDRLMHALPVEMMMTRKELREHELERGKRR